MSDALEIAIEGLRVFARHGARAEERVLGQRFTFDVVLVPRSTAACASDQLSDAVDYGAVAARVVEVASGGPYRLLERLADAVAATLVAEFAVAEVRVRVTKPAAPVEAIIDHVSVSVTRRAP